MGIYHADLHLGNIIKFKKDKNGPFDFIFKIIDFNYAFRVSGAEDPLLNKTKEIIRFCLSSKGIDQKIILNYIFRGKRSLELLFDIINSEATEE